MQEIDRLKAYIHKYKMRKLKERRRDRENRREVSGYYKSELPKMELRRIQQARRADRVDYAKKWREKNAEKIKQYKRKWRAENRAELNEYHREYMRYYRAKQKLRKLLQELNREKYREYRKEYNKKNRERLSEYQRARYAQNETLRERKKEQARKWRAANLERARDLQRAAQKRFQEKKRAERAAAIADVLEKVEGGANE